MNVYLSPLVSWLLLAPVLIGVTVLTLWWMATADQLSEEEADDDHEDE